MSGQAMIDRLGTVDLVDLAVEAADTTMNIGVLVRLEGGPLRDHGHSGWRRFGRSWLDA